MSMMENEPSPLSVAPLARSQQSKCPPMMITSSGLVEPLISAMTLRAVTAALLFVMERSAVAELSRAMAMRSRAPSSLLMHATGIAMG